MSKAGSRDVAGTKCADCAGCQRMRHKRIKMICVKCGHDHETGEGLSGGMKVSP